MFLLWLNFFDDLKSLMRQIIEDIAPKDVCSLQDTETDKTSLQPGSQSESQMVQTCLQRYDSVNELYHLPLKQSYHAVTAPSRPFKNHLEPVFPSPSAAAFSPSLSSFYRHPAFWCVEVW